jgi:hypothetical protein
MGEPNRPHVSALRDKNGKLPAYAWPCAYPIYYLTEDAGIICPKCANSDDCNRSDIDIVDYGIHWEGAPIICANCNSEIESAYGDPDDD